MQQLSFLHADAKKVTIGNRNIFRTLCPPYQQLILPQSEHCNLHSDLMSTQCSDVAAPSRINCKIQEGITISAAERVVARGNVESTSPKQTSKQPAETDVGDLQRSCLRASIILPVTGPGPGRQEKHSGGVG